MRFAREFTYFLITSVLILAMCEVFLKFSDSGPVSSTEFYEGQGRVKRKGITYVYFNEGFGIVNYNEHGFIGEPMSLKKRCK